MGSTDVLQIIQDLKDSKNTPDYIEFDDGNLVLWTASLVLLNHIGQKGSLKGVRVLELGSGLGHLAVGLYRSAVRMRCQCGYPYS
jgi:predicted RNA methylase